MHDMIQCERSQRFRVPRPPHPHPHPRRHHQCVHVGALKINQSDPHAVLVLSHTKMDARCFAFVLVFPVCERVCAPTAAGFVRCDSGMCATRSM